jgi:hypothetical protein
LIFHFNIGETMKNPWTKKNPFLSMWLSGANAVAGKVRGHATAQAKRQASSAVKQGARQMMDLWMGPFATTRRTRKKRSR